MQLNSYLFFKGNCKEAFTFYAKVLGGKITTMMTHGETPAAEHTKPEWQDKIIHARMRFGDQLLMGSDAPPDRYSAPHGIYVSISIGDVTQARRIFTGLAEGGRVEMPFEKTFWVAGFGMLVDRFGVPWMVNCEQPS